MEGGSECGWCVERSDPQGIGKMEILARGMGEYVSCVRLGGRSGGGGVM